MPLRLLSAQLILAIALAGSASAQLCPTVADPCVVAVSQNVPTGTVVDIGSRGFVLAAGTTLTVLDTGLFSVLAGSVTLGDNAKILATGGATGFGGFVSLTSQTSVSLGSGTVIDTSSATAGGLDIVALDGDVTLNGRLTIRATAREGSGGDLSVTALNGGIVLAGSGANVTGGDRFASGGTVSLDATGPIVLDASVQNKGSDGGDFEVVEASSFTLADGAEINVNATEALGDGGDIDISAGDVVLAGNIFTRGSGDSIDGGGSGGLIDILSTGTVELSGLIDGNGVWDGSGTAVDVDAVHIISTGTINGTGPFEGDGGEVFWIATGDVFINGTIDVRAGLGGGMFNFGGFVDVLADGDFTLGENARVRAGAVFRSGLIDIFSCSATLSNGALLENLGPPGASGGNIFRVREASFIGGVAKTDGVNAIFYRNVAPTIAAQRDTFPAWTATRDPTLPPCTPPPTTSTSSSSTTSSSVTTTTSTSTTSTSSSSTSSSSTSSSSTSSSTSSTTSSSSTSTTSTSSTVTTSTSSTVTTTTSSTATTTTTSTTTSTSSTSTSSTSSTSTTATTVTTTTTLPLSCLDEPLDGFDAVGCAVGLLDDDVRVRSDDELGGKKPARGLRGRIAKALVLLDKGREQVKVKKARRFVKKARKKIASFEKKVTRFVDKDKIDAALAAPLLQAAEIARLRLETFEVELLSQ